MGRKALIERQKKRQKIVAKYKDRRNSLRTTIHNMDLPVEERMAAQMSLQKLPRYSAPTGLRNYCKITMRTGGYYRLFEMSRIELRKNGLNGLLPGVVKSSW
jgi:small subunit ribosomal protein S14